MTAIACMQTPMQVQIKQFLERVYGLKVTSVHTVNYEGKKKRRKTGYFLTSTYKKASTALPWFVCTSSQEMLLF